MLFLKDDLYDIFEDIKNYFSADEILEEFIKYMSYEQLKDYIETFLKLHDLEMHTEKNDEYEIYSLYIDR